MKSSIQSNRLLLVLFANIFFITSGSTQGTSTVTSMAQAIPLETYLMLAVILVEVALILFLVGMMFQFLGLYKTRTVNQETPVAKPSLFQRLNKTVAIEDEIQLDLNHNYDGIRELDNKTPDWWTYAFYFTILFAVVYLYRMFVSESLPSQLIELKAENQRAEASMSRFLVASANNVDESNVTLLGPEEIIKGSMTFKTNCAVCHGVSGEGNVVGPNLTDDHWLHKGSIKDIFKTIKYGVPEKGMKSWAADFSPLQIAQLASYVKSLHGSNPPNGREKQGELFVESDGMVVDSVQVTK